MIPEVEGKVIKGHHAVVYQDRVMSFQSGERAREKKKEKKNKKWRITIPVFYGAKTRVDQKNTFMSPWPDREIYDLSSSL